MKLTKRIARSRSSGMAAVLIAVAVGLAATPASYAATFSVEGWEGGLTQNGPRSVCQMVRRVTDEVSLIAYYDITKKMHFMIYNQAWNWAAGQSVSINLGFDSYAFDFVAEQKDDPQTVEIVFETDNGVGIDDALIFGHTLNVKGLGLDFSADTTNIAAAISALEACVDAAFPAAGGPPVAGSDDRAEALSEALKNSQQPMLASYVCDVTATALTGLLDISGENKTTRMTLSVDASGQLHVNGTTIAPVHTEPQPSEGSQLALVAYSAQSVAASSSGVPATMPGISAESMQGLQAAMNMMLGQAFQGRDRYMVISLNNDTVQFFDLSPDGQMVNTSASTCARTQ